MTITLNESDVVVDLLEYAHHLGSINKLPEIDEDKIPIVAVHEKYVDLNKSISIDITGKTTPRIFNDIVRALKGLNGNLYCNTTMTGRNGKYRGVCYANLMFKVRRMMVTVPFEVKGDTLKIYYANQV